MDHLTKKDWKDIFADCGLRKGSRVLFQADLSRCPATAGGDLTVLEALMETITETGLLILPAFTNTALDPACLQDIHCEYEGWPEFRRSLHGYDPLFSESDALSALLIKMEGARRSEHPSKSFVLWGTYDPAWLRQPLDFPVSFGHVFSLFEETTAVNLLVGIPWQESLLGLAMAHLTGLERVGLEKAWLHRPKRNLGKVYLTSCPREDTANSVRELLQTETLDTLAGPVYRLSLYSPPQKTLEIWKKSRQSGERDC